MEKFFRWSIVDTILPIFTISTWKKNDLNRNHRLMPYSVFYCLIACKPCFSTTFLPCLSLLQFIRKSSLIIFDQETHFQLKMIVLYFPFRPSEIILRLAKFNIFNIVTFNTLKVGMDVCCIIRKQGLYCWRHLVTYSSDSNKAIYALGYYKKVFN